jgi:tetratricopeptide (TPR) repeat protein
VVSGVEVATSTQMHETCVLEGEAKMLDYRSMNSEELLRYVKQGDAWAMFYMQWQFELIKPAGENSPIEDIVAWKDFWLEKGASTGHIPCKGQYASDLIDEGRPIFAENRQKAMDLFESIVRDYDAGRLQGNFIRAGVVAKIELGIMLCEGYGTKRDVVGGLKMMEEGASLARNDGGPGFAHCYRIGEVYATGLAQLGEEPSIADLEKAIQYFKDAISRYNPQLDAPYLLDAAKQMLETQSKRIDAKITLLESLGYENTVDTGAEARRNAWMALTGERLQLHEAIEAAKIRLKQRMLSEGW